MERAAPSEPVNQASQNKSDKASAILAGAWQVFAEQGYAASMERIAAAAGVSKPTLYSYFQDKEGLFVALVQQHSQIGEQTFSALEATPDAGPPAQVLRWMAAQMLAEFARNQPLMTLMRLIIGESERFPELARTFVREVEKPMLGRLVAYLESQSALNLPDPTVTARIFVGAIVHYAIVQYVLHGDDLLPLERDRLLDGLIDLIVASREPS